MKPPKVQVDWHGRPMDEAYWAAIDERSRLRKEGERLRLANHKRQIGSFWETVCDKPRGSYQGTYMGVVIFGEDKVSPTEYQRHQYADLLANPLAHECEMFVVEP